MKKTNVGLKHGFRSGLEETVAKQIKDAGMEVVFEGGKVEYTTPATLHRYTWDFRLPNGVYIETKGRFLPADRKKHQLIKAQHPHLDIRFVFTRSAATISKTSKTTYAAWCIKNGFQYADKLIPGEWLKEKPNRKTVQS